MQIRYYSVYDKVADEFGPLFSHRNDNSAYRSYELGLKDKNPDEYELWFIGVFDDSRLENLENDNRFISKLTHQVVTDREE